jgi:type VI secretion system protein ImpI
MSLVLTIEHGPRAQAVRQARLDEGELIIGRSPEADWQIDDPDMFVSRAHCKITSEPDGYVITDTSSSGLFIDDSAHPLGAGNSARLRHGMRLRLGDYILWVEVQDTGAAVGRAPPQTAHALNGSVGFESDDFFSTPIKQEPARSRPPDLPNPFENPEPGAFRGREAANSHERQSAAFDDPFSLDPIATPAEERPEERDSGPASTDPFSFEQEKPVPERNPEPHEPSMPPLDFSFEQVSPHVKASARRRAQDLSPKPAPWDIPPIPTGPPPAQHTPAGGRSSTRPSQPATIDALALRAAFLRGLGMEDTDLPGLDPITEMERFGREYRLMMDGLMQLLRKRAEEKGNARVAQTVVGASEVNPLKFLPTVDDVLAMIMTGRSPGFLAGEPAITDAVRDLAQHHVRAWRGVQEALRRMIDRFDPTAIEEELKSSSTIETLLAGGRGAKLWELYQKRHREIAQSAEDRFLGEIGADFRDAYEEE